MAKSPAIIFDLETCSLADLRKVGAHRYARDPSTRVIAAVMRLFHPPYIRRTVRLDLEVGYLGEQWCKALNSDCLIVAHNAAFERAIWQHILHPLHGWPECPPLEQWVDTMAMALYFGLPPKLEDACQVLKLPHKKDMEGHRLMLQMSRPRKIEDDGTVRWWHDEDPAKLTRLTDYCTADVDATTDLYHRLPLLPERERRIWRMDQQINDRGVGVDVPLVKQLQGLSEQATRRLNDECRMLTFGAVPTLTSTAKLLGFLKDKGALLPNLQRATLEKYIQQPSVSTQTRAYRLIELRLAASRSSVAKLSKLQDYTDDGDPVARGVLQYYGANRTGRWAGRGPQPHNLPRPARGLDVDLAISLVKQGATIDQLELFLGHDAMTVLSGCLRGCFTAPEPDGVVIAADYSQVEARVAAALAHETSLLSVFARKEDLYVATARDMGRTDPVQDRPFGKLAALSCQYQTGGPKLKVTAEKDYGIILTDTEAQTVVDDWRAARPHIVSMWWTLDREAQRAIRSPDSWCRVHDHCGGVAGEFIFTGPRGFRGNLYLKLLSGRMLCYQQAGIEPHPTFGKDSVVYWGLDQTTNKWSKVWAYGGMWFNNLVQATARDVMADTMLELHENPSPLQLMLSVHDELVGWARAGQAVVALQVLLGAMKSATPWLPSLPIEAAGYIAPRFKKS